MFAHNWFVRSGSLTRICPYGWVIRTIWIGSTCLSTADPYESTRTDVNLSEPCRYHHTYCNSSADILRRLSVFLNRHIRVCKSSEGKYTKGFAKRTDLISRFPILYEFIYSNYRIPKSVSNAMVTAYQLIRNQKTEKNRVPSFSKALNLRRKHCHPHIYIFDSLGASVQ